MNYIVNSVLSGPFGGPIPDIIVIVEVFSRTREVSTEGIVLRPGSEAGRAVVALLNRIRATPILIAGGANWCVVPPLNIGLMGQQEAVAVFFNATRIQFTGPNIYWQLYGPPGQIVGQSVPVDANSFAGRMNYQGAWQQGPLAGLNRSTAFPGVALPVPEAQLAGEWRYYNPRPNPFPLPPLHPPPGRIRMPYVGCRAPFYTRFLDLNTNTTINLFSVHTSPSSAARAVQRMGQIPEMIGAVPPNTVNVILGDFNVDTFQSWPIYTQWMVPAAGGGYTPAFDPRDTAGNVNPLCLPYCMTHLLPRTQSTPYNNTGVPSDPQHNVYPRYGYMGNSFPQLGNKGAIDNVFTRYGNAAPPVNNATVVNTITGAPYNRFPRPPLVPQARINGVPFASTFGVPNVLYNPVPPANAAGGGIDPGAAAAGAALTNFGAWNNYGKIHSTSDHLPLLIDV
jgi:endonuclease/exonuclease/phosphatase family metal-dependent hydrolase